jgi:nitronate monooxygenase
MGLKNLPGPIVTAPMAGGPTTPELVSAVGAAGGLGFLAAGGLPAERLAAQIAAVRETGAPFGVNVFVPGPNTADPAALARYSAELAPLAAALGTRTGEPAWHDDEYEAKLDLLVGVGVPLVTFTFGCPGPEDVAALHRAGSEVGITVTTPAEAVEADQVGADFVVAQGIEAGGHRGGWHGGEQYGLLSLVRLIRSTVDIRLVAAGGIADATGVRAALTAGAAAVAAGTAFLRCPEAGTSPAYRAALADPRFTETRLTRAFTGRPARGLTNTFVRDHTGTDGYPQVHQLTQPLRAAAAAVDNPEYLSLWAGQSHALTRDLPAADIVKSLTP